MPVADGFAVDLPALRGAADGIRRTMFQVATVPLDPVAGASGHPGLAQAVDGFVERWRHGTNNLVADAAQLAARLSDAEVAYTAVETTAGRLPNGLLGRPTGPDPAAR